MHLRTPLVDFWHSLRHFAGHAAITLLAVGLAFSLPQAASYILYQWWPLIHDDARLLVFTEIGFAAVLVVVLNLLKLTWDFHRRARLAGIASLVYAREGNGRYSRWAKDRHLRRLPWKRDLTIMAVTGYGTFAADDSLLKDMLQDCYEIRVMLLNPYGEGAAAYAAAHDDPAAMLATIRREVGASIESRRRLHGAGRKIVLKFYDDTPFWKLVFVGEHVWVRYCHTMRDVAKFPEYVFALQGAKPNLGFFPPFYTHFLDRWNDPGCPEYAFDTDDLVHGAASEAAPRRVPYPGAQIEAVEPAAAA